MWTRHPFFGGCSYHNEDSTSVVTGHYSPANPLEFEEDCKSWTLNGSGDYSSVAEAMAADE
jgi:hypothetical protein